MSRTNPFLRRSGAFTAFLVPCNPTLPWQVQLPSCQLTENMSNTRSPSTTRKGGNVCGRYLGLKFNPAHVMSHNSFCSIPARARLDQHPRHIVKTGVCSPVQQADLGLESRETLYDGFCVVGRHGQSILAKAQRATLR